MPTMQIYVTPEQFTFIQKEAVEKNVSMSFIIRPLIDEAKKKKEALL